MFSPTFKTRQGCDDQRFHSTSTGGARQEEEREGSSTTEVKASKSERKK